MKIIELDLSLIKNKTLLIKHLLHSIDSFTILIFFMSSEGVFSQYIKTTVQKSQQEKVENH